MGPAEGYGVAWPDPARPTPRARRTDVSNRPRVGVLRGGSAQNPRPGRGNGSPSPRSDEHRVASEPRSGPNRAGRNPRWLVPESAPNHWPAPARSPRPAQRPSARRLRPATGSTRNADPTAPRPWREPPPPRAGRGLSPAPRRRLPLRNLPGPAEPTRRYSRPTETSRGAPILMAIATPYSDKTDEQKAICEMVRQFADEQIIPNAEHYDHEDTFPEPIVEQMKELGLFGVTIPEEYGGMGLDLTTYAMIVEELSRGWISISGIVNTHFIGSYLLMKFGTEEQKQKYLPKMATGEIRAAFSLSEPELGSDVAGDQDHRQEGRRRRLRDQRPEDVGHQRPAVRAGVHAGQDRPERRAQVQGHDLLHRREGAGRQREHRRVRGPQRAAEDQEDGLQGRRVDRAGVRRLPLPGREHPRRRGGGPRPGLRPDDGRARGRPRQRRRPRRRASPSARSSWRSATRRSARPSASRSPSTRRSSSSSPTWPPRSTPRGC